MGGNCELCLSAHGHLPGTLRYVHKCVLILILYDIVDKFINSDDAGAHNDNEEQEAKGKEGESPMQKFKNFKVFP